MEQELISIIVPIYNIREYLERCISSILAQTYSTLEILMIDDGSTDGTSELCDQIARRDTRIRVFHKKNGGSSSARNLGIRKAKGKFLGFIDSDDYIEPDMFEKLYTVLQERHVKMAQGGREEIDEQGNRLPDICTPPPNIEVIESEAFMKELLLHKGDCSFCTKLTEKALFDQVSFPEGVLNEDFHVLVQMLPKIDKIASIPDRVYHVFYKRNSNTRKQTRDEFSRVYGDNIDNADFVTKIVQEDFPALSNIAIRFGLYQRLDYLLHIPISKMEASNIQYEKIVTYLKNHRKQICDSKNLTLKNKVYLLLFSVAPKKLRQAHARLKHMK